MQLMSLEWDTRKIKISQCIYHTLNYLYGFLKSTELRNISYRKKNPLHRSKALHLHFFFDLPHIFGNEQTKHTMPYTNSVTDQDQKTQIFGVLSHAVSVMFCLWFCIWSAKNMVENLCLRCLFSFHVKVIIDKRTTQVSYSFNFCHHGSIFTFCCNNGWRVVL